jgi:ribose transport system permease protein
MSSLLRSLLKFQESGLLLVILAFGLLLTVFSGTVRTPLFERTADGGRQRVFTVNADGERVPAFAEKNKFFNAQNLAQLAKDTSFTTLMAVAMAILCGIAFVVTKGQSVGGFPPDLRDFVRLMAGVAAA